MRPLLYDPNGGVLAVETTVEDRKDETLIEVFGLLQGIPTCLERWAPHGGPQRAATVLSSAIIETIGKERLEQAWGITIHEGQRPKTFSDVEGQAAAAIALRGPGDAAAHATMTGLAE